jgi:hypothetical protein
MILYAKRAPGPTMAGCVLNSKKTVLQANEKFQTSIHMYSANSPNTALEIY